MRYNKEKGGTFMRIYFVRHGQTEFNKAKIIQGREVDSPLTQEGQAGARHLGKTLSSVAFTKAYVSPLYRAVHTANLVLSENNYPRPAIHLTPNFRELYFGKYEGQPIESFAKGGQYEAFKTHPDTFDAKCTGGETYYDLRERGQMTLQHILETSNQEDTILIVAHAVFLTTLIKSILNVPMKDIRKEGLLHNTSVSIIDFDQHLQPHLVTYDWIPEKEN